MARRYFRYCRYLFPNETNFTFDEENSRKTRSNVDQYVNACYSTQQDRYWEWLCNRLRILRMCAVTLTLLHDTTCTLNSIRINLLDGSVVTKNFRPATVVCNCVYQIKETLNLIPRIRIHYIWQIKTFWTIPHIFVVFCCRPHTFIMS